MKNRLKRKWENQISWLTNETYINSEIVAAVINNVTVVSLEEDLRVF